MLSGSSRSERVQALGQKAPLRFRSCELESATVCGRRFVDALEPSQEVGPRCVEEVVLVQRQVLQQSKATLRPVGHGNRDGAIELDDRGARLSCKLRVERGDLLP